MFTVIRKELAVVLRDRAAILTLFLSPLLFISVMSLALGQAFAGLGETAKVKVAVVDHDGKEAGRALVAALGGSKDLELVTSSGGKALSETDADRLVRTGRSTLALVVPAGWSRDTAAGRTPRVGFVVDPAASGQVVQPLEAALKATADLVATKQHAVTALSAQLATAKDPAAKRKLSGEIEALRKQQADTAADTRFPAGTKQTKYPTVFQQNVPGYTVMYVFFIVTTMAGSIMTERREGTFRRLLSTPLPRSRLLLGKILPYALITIVQVVLLTAFGNLAFGMSLGDHPLALIPVTLALALCACSLGVLLAAWARTDSQVSGLGTIAVLVLAALGGCMVPLVFMPDFMKSVAQFTPQGQALTAYQDVLVRGAGVTDVLPATGILCGLAVAFLALAVPRFRFLR
ncbi:ABC transporter permease [Streptomyces sp. AV19]|uniref:ABC transporter permease n=1 Tax=Streptomyces sp. AV19 TaxID=2793068 RepID=UPI0018FEDD1E|nr:ABC transporter permease [Streptomyces sp. AV19]MBH1937196.1 ABC transporter permease [Streptomyces sp. AV19]MDG4533469.1 ABC transporter permease [Streptomyces sp. AV19]